MNKLSTLVVLSFLSSQALAGNSVQVPIGNDIAMIGISLILAGVAARIIARRSGR